MTTNAGLKMIKCEFEGAGKKLFEEADWTQAADPLGLRSQCNKASSRAFVTA
jgi:hypothetical protein